MWGTNCGEMELSQKLKVLMRAQRYSQSQVAVKLGVSQPQVSTWVTGKSRPDVRETLVLARLLGVPMEYLVDDAMETVDAESPEQVREILKLVRYVGGFDVAVARLTLAPTVEAEGMYGDIRRARRASGEKGNDRRSGA